MSTFYTRKQLRIKDYDYSSNGAYFITICTLNKKNIFGYVDFSYEAKVILNDYGCVVDKYLNNINELLIYVIMPNHLHMILLLDDDNNKSVSQIVRSFKSLVSKELGFSVWHRSFHDRIIRNEKEFYYIWDYVEHNAERWREDTYFVE